MGGGLMRRAGDYPAGEAGTNPGVERRRIDCNRSTSVLPPVVGQNQRRNTAYRVPQRKHPAFLRVHFATQRRGSKYAAACSMTGSTLRDAPHQDAPQSPSTGSWFRRKGEEPRLPRKKGATRSRWVARRTQALRPGMRQ